jgi:hypothetical protein
MTIAAMIRFVKTVGFPIAVALILLYALLFRGPDATAQQVGQLNTKFAAHEITLRESMEIQRAYMERQVRFSYLTCLNTAGKNRAARDACEAVLK